MSVLSALTGTRWFIGVLLSSKPASESGGSIGPTSGEPQRFVSEVRLRATAWPQVIPPITWIVYLLTGGLVGIGLLYDLWTLNGQVSEINRGELYGVYR